MLVLRFALLNIVAAGLLAAVYLQGWLDDGLRGYTAWLTLGICAVFAYGLLLCALRVWRTNNELNALGQDEPPSLSRAGSYLASDGGRSAVAQKCVRAT